MSGSTTPEAEAGARVPAPEERLGGWGPWLLGALVLCAGLLLWDGFPPGIWHDDGVYVLLGKSLAQGDGLRYVGVAGEPLAPKFPPLFPLLLAGVWLLVPEISDNSLLLGGVNLLVLAAAATLLAAYIRKGLGQPGLLALAAAGLACLSPELWRVAFVPLSEPLFLVTLILALWAGARMEARTGWAGVAFFLLAAGAAAYTRSVGVALFPAAALVLFFRGRRGPALGILAGGLALLLPWLLWSSRAVETIPEPLRDILGPYGQWWIREVARDPVSYGPFLLANLKSLLVRSLVLLLPGVTGSLLWLGLLLLPFLALGLWEMARRTPFLPVTLAVSVGVLLLWPFGDIRLLVPFAPFLVLAVFLGCRVAWTATSSRRPLGLVARILASAWIFVFVAFSGHRLATGWPGQPYHVRSAALVRAVQAVQAHTPPDAVVGAPELWSGLHLFTGRTVVPSAPFRPLAGETAPWGSPGDQYELWEVAGVTHLLVEHGGKVHGEALDRVDARCEPGTVQLLSMEESQFLVRLGWDRACREALGVGGAAGGPGDPGAVRSR